MLGSEVLEIGYLLMERFWRFGYAKEAAVVQKICLREFK